MQKEAIKLFYLIPAVVNWVHRNPQYDVSFSCGVAVFVAPLQGLDAHKAYSQFRYIFEMLGLLDLLDEGW